MAIPRYFLGLSSSEHSLAQSGNLLLTMTKNLVLQTPVVFMIFNRPVLTKQVFAEIRRAQPAKLLVVADGPRFPKEREKCAAARGIIEHGVDWDCSVLVNYSEVNLGCKRRVSSGLDWAFEQCEEAIILEDDCVPHPTFFRYCAELLERYRDDNRIAYIAGENSFFGYRRYQYSYYFSHYSGIWGWATWQRFWKYNDVEIKLWPELKKKGWLDDMFRQKKEALFGQDAWDRMDEIDSWDYQLLFTQLVQGACSISSNVNLVSNIGFGPDATHTKSPNSIRANMPTEPMQFPLKHPPFMIVDRASDKRRFDLIAESIGRP